MWVIDRHIDYPVARETANAYRQALSRKIDQRRVPLNHRFRDYAKRRVRGTDLIEPIDDVDKIKPVCREFGADVIGVEVL